MSMELTDFTWISAYSLYDDLAAGKPLMLTIQSSTCQLHTWTHTVVLQCSCNVLMLCSMLMQKHELLEHTGDKMQLKEID